MNKDKISQQKKAYFRKTMFFSSLSFIVIYFVLMGAVNGYTWKNFLLAVVTGIVWGLLMYFIMPFTLKKAGKWLEKKVPDPVLDSDEQIEMSAPANYFRSKRLADGGKLFLTNKRLVFTAHKYNFKKSQVSINLEDILSAQGIKVSNAIDNGLRITQRDITVYDFVIDNADEWISVLQDKTT